MFDNSRLTDDQLTELRSLKQCYASHRICAPDLDEHLYDMLPVLDHGFIRVIDYMGNDAAIVQAARTSYGHGTKAVSDDRALIRYLMRHSHTSPFEMCEIKLHLKMPLFVARQWLRHRTANVNEISGRYSIINAEWYVPDADTIAEQSQVNNQGRGKQLDDFTADKVRAFIEDSSEAAFRDYAELHELDGNGFGIARELARMVIPQNVYTEFYWKIDLHNLLHFLRLRMDAHAQYEFRAFAWALYDILQLWVPQTMEAFSDYKVNALTFSRQELAVLQSLFSETSLKELDANRITMSSELSKGEARELVTKLQKMGV